MSKHVSRADLQGDSTTHLKGAAKAGGGKGCVTKCFTGEPAREHHGNYRYNGYHAQTASKQALYQPDLRRWKALEKKPRQERKLGFGANVKVPVADPTVAPGWRFKGSNYKEANRPFAHNYHHILPWYSLKKALGSSNDLFLLQKAGYNLNGGTNLIILPSFDAVANVLEMYKHPNNHPNYNKDIACTLNLSRYCLIGDEKHMTEENAAQLKQLLEKFSETEFWNLVRGGKKRDAEHVDAHAVTSLIDVLSTMVR